MYFLVCLLILVIIIKFLNVKELFNVKESFNGACNIIFEPYLNSQLNTTDRDSDTGIWDLYKRKISVKKKRLKGGQFKGFIEGRIKDDKKDYNSKVGYFQYLHDIDIDNINPEAHNVTCLSALVNI